MIEDKDDCKLPFKDHMVIIDESCNDHDYFSIKTQHIINSHENQATQVNLCDQTTNADVSFSSQKQLHERLS